jgi:MFS family permease
MPARSVLGTSMCTPAAPQILVDFHSDQDIFLTLLVSVWELGEAVGPLVIGPLSEIYGRLPIYHTTNLIFIALSVACAVSSSLNMLLAFRFLNGLGVAAISLNSSVLGDLFIQEERAGFFAIMALPALSGVAIAPVIGGYVGERLGWRWVFWITAMVGSLCEAGFLLVFRESYKVKILKKKAEKMRKETRNQNFHSIYDSNYTSRYQLFTEALVRPTKIVIMSPIVLIVSLYFAMVFGYLYLITTTMTQVFEDNYNVSEGTAGLMFLGRGETLYTAYNLIKD